MVSPPIIDLVENNVRTYLPKKDQDNEEYLNRIYSAFLQIIRLLYQGVSHRRIADLIRENYQSIHAGTEWNQTSQSYEFLWRSSEQMTNENLPDDEGLIDKFDEQTETRMMKFREIAKELLARR